MSWVLGFGVGAILLAVPWPGPLLGVAMIIGVFVTMLLGLRAAPKYAVEQAMRAIQWQAEDLAKYAGNAAAAARLALARTGDAGLLEIVAPSAPTIRAHDALAAAKERLVMLTQVWNELDPRGAALSEALDHDAQRELPT